MQGRNPSTAIPDPDQKRKQRLRMLRNCTIVVLVVVLIVLATSRVAAPSAYIRSPALRIRM